MRVQAKGREKRRKLKTRFRGDNFNADIQEVKKASVLSMVHKLLLFHADDSAKESKWQILCIDHSQSPTLELRIDDYVTTDGIGNEKCNSA